MKMNLNDLKPLFGRTQGNLGNVIIQGIMKDTRDGKKQTLYAPIAGERFDGHDFLEQAIEQGAVATLWENGKQLPDTLPEDFPVLYTDNTISALQTIAKWYLKKVHPIVIGVTGSNGKTTTKDMIESVVSTTFKTHKTKGNYNNHIGLPLTILSMDDATEVLILEMGMSGYGEISLLSHLAEPDVAIITNIGESHIEHLGSREGIAKAKLEIRDGLQKSGICIIDGDEPLLSHLKEEDVLTVGFNPSTTMQIIEVESHSKGFTFQLEGGTTTYKLPMLGKHNVKNAAYAIAVGHYLNIEENKIKEGLSHLCVTNMRLESFIGKKGAFLINDAYNASPTSMIAALDTLNELDGFPVKAAVLGDMYELGTHEEALHRNVARHIQEGITEVIAIGAKGRWIADELHNHPVLGVNVSFFLTKEEAKPAIERLLSKETAVLFKASRGMAMETLIREFIEDEQEIKK